MERSSKQFIAGISKHFQPIWVLVIPALLMCIALFSPWMSYQLVVEGKEALPPLSYFLWNNLWGVWTVCVAVILFCSLRDVFGRYHLITILTCLLGYHGIVNLFGHYQSHLSIPDFQNVELRFGYYLLIGGCCLMMMGLLWVALQARAKEKREIELRYGQTKPKSS